MHHNNGNNGDRGPCGGIRTGKIKRFGISADSRLLENFDSLISEKGYVNRSEAIRDLIRDQLVEFAWAKNKDDMVGTITIVYSYESGELIDKLREIKHQNHYHILSSLYVHVDEHNCLEVLVVKGKSEKIKNLSDRLIGTKGVIHGKLTMSTTGKEVC